MADAPIFCSLVPREIYELAGLVPREIVLDDWPRGTGAYQCVLHDNICSYAKVLFELLTDAARPYPLVVVPNSCDAMRRLHDVLCRETPAERAFLLDVPHDDTASSVRYLASQYASLLERLGVTASNFAAARERATATEEAGSVESDCVGTARATAAAVPATRPGVGIAGSVYPSAVFREVLCAAGADVAVLRRCGMRLPPTDAQGRQLCESASVAEFCERLAARYLQSAVCPRMVGEAFVRFLASEIATRQLAGLVVPVLKFCDTYHLAVERLKARLPGGFPVLLVEGEVTAGFAEQTVTRLEAFMEQLKREPRGRTEGTGGRCAVGVDVGSTLVKAVLVDAKMEILHTHVRGTTGRVAESSEQAVAQVLAAAGLDRGQVSAFGVTGYGRKAVAADTTATEICTHARGVNRFFPARATVIDVGGQDSKVILVDARGAVVRFTMNDKCAAGTGRFIEATIRALDLDFERFAALSLAATREVPVTSMCSVFAESEVISLTARGEPLSGIARGIHASIARRLAGMVRRVEGQPPFVITGGASQDRGLVRELGRELGAEVTVLEYSPYAGAIGAAILALEG
jgi:predicted CoA-substrate-specific enzyme activase